MISIKNKKYFWWKIMICSLAIILSNCKIPYEPKLKSSDTNSLVVEGYIDGAIPMIIKLSRTRMLTNGDTAARKYELGARVIVEDDKQDSYPLSELGNGVYSSLNTLPLNTSNQYRLHIFTTENEEYLSDFVPFKPSPPIDSIGWNFKYDGVQIYANTHDPNNATTYYRWEYSETWEYHAYYSSLYEYDQVHDTVIPRLQQVYTCWQTDSSTSILLGSSAKLTSDVINEMALTYIQPHDTRLSVLYSIWVKQYALDVNGYNYWSAMQSNTESIGSIFDPQPNETAGNIHCVTSPAELVVGYINAGNTVQKRVFISNSSLPSDWNQYPFCLDTIVPNNKSALIHFFAESTFVPIGIPPPGIFPPVAYTASFEDCVDCRTYGGVTIKPSFWP